tara:strand:- start:20056 stop:20745 length:690 start_codon:yes stop_codon:yes gene_type:complete
VLQEIKLCTYSRAAIKAAKEYLSKAGTVRRGVYDLSEEATINYENAYENIAKLMKFGKEEIFFVSSKREFDLRVLDGPFNEIPKGFVDISSILHRDLCFDKAFLSGEAIGVPGLDVVGMKKEVLESMDALEFGGDMISYVGKYNFKYAELPHKFSAGTPDVASIVALGAAANEYSVSENIDTVSEHFKDLLQSRGIDFRYFHLSNCFEVSSKLLYVPRDNPEEIFEVLV